MRNVQTRMCVGWSMGMGSHDLVGRGWKSPLCATGKSIHDNTINNRYQFNIVAYFLEE
jgi:hypothetical protein